LLRAKFAVFRLSFYDRQVAFVALLQSRKFFCEGNLPFSRYAFVRMSRTGKKRMAK
jgi:hypothetical protein